MPEPPDPQGMLDLSKVKPKDYAKPPEALAGFKARAVQGDSPLFPAPPVFEDILALGKAKPADGSLFECFASLLGGLSAGPALVMGMFRAVNREDVIVRLFAALRPVRGEKPQPLYFAVQRGHAELAIRNKWVGPTAPTWLALYVAVYYAYIGDRKAFYERKDLGGADNAAWLVMFGKDSSRANYPEDEESAPAARTGGGGGDGKAALDAPEVWEHVLGLSEAAADSGFCARCIFGEDKGPGPLTKQWLAWLTKAAPTPKTGLRAGLTPETVGKPGELRKWLEQRKGLPHELRFRLLLFLEVNGLVPPEEPERYPKETRAVWDEIGKALRIRSPVALLLRGDDKDLAKLADRAGVLEVVDTQTLELPSKKAPRALRYVLVRAAGSPEGAGRKFRFQAADGVQALRVEPKKKAVHWLELEQVMTCCQRVFGGADAVAALAQASTQVSFTIEVSGPRRIKIG